MATYTEELDKALLNVPWLAKVDTASKPYMLKYAPHPTKPGYISLLTDLTKVYFEPLAGIRVLARQREVEEKLGQSQSQRDGGSSLDLGGEEAVAEVLEGVSGLLGDLGDDDIEVAPGDLYDLDVTIKSSQGNWLFHMTEIRYGCLEVITRHIIHPLALSISSSRRPSSTTDDQIVELVSSNTVLEAMNRHSSHTAKPKASTKGDSSVKVQPESPTPVEEPKQEDRGEGSIKSRLVRRRPGAASKPSSPGLSSRPPPTRRTKSPSPMKPSAKEAIDSQVQGYDQEEDETMPEEPDSRSPSPAPGSRARSLSPSRGKRDRIKAEPNEEVGDDKTPTPPPPPVSQKTQEEKDEEEEEALAKKREEMKRRMGAGGGGRLVRRRFG